MTKDQQIALLKREAERLHKEREKYLGSFHEFVKAGWIYTTPSGLPFQEQNHVQILCEHLEALQARELTKLVVNIPPGTGKSRICSILWHAWSWAKNPNECIMFASYSQGLGIEMGEYVVKLLRSPWYKKLFVPRLPNVAPPSDFKLENGGWRLTTTPGGEATGSHPTIRQLDDPIKAEDSTRKECDNTNHWLDNTWVSRRDLFAPVPVVDLCVMQRLSENDPAQHLIDQGFESLVLPLHYEPKQYSISRKLSSGRELLCDWRSEKGEKLTAMIGEDYINGLQPYVYHAQYQQKPTGEGDRVFRPEWLEKRWNPGELPKHGMWCISVDAAFKGEPTSDYVVMQVWCKAGPNYYLVDQVRGHLDFDQTCDELKKLAAKYPQARAKIVEAKANGDAIITHLSKTLSGLEGIDPKGGKFTRANNVTPFFSAGNVFLPAQAIWLGDWLREMVSFPRGKHDDVVDSCSQALTWLSERGAAITAPDEDMLAALVGGYVVKGQDAPVNSGYAAWRMHRRAG